MMKDLEKQMKAVQVAMETAKILNDLESKHTLSIELIRLSQMMEISDDMMHDIRVRYGLNTAVWIMAERDVINESLSSTRVDE